MQNVYVMRVWHEKGHSEAWRVTITDTRSHEKFHFASLQTLLEFFREKLEQSGAADKLSLT